VTPTALVERTRPALTLVRSVSRRVRALIGPATGVVSPLGWAVLALALAAWVVGLRLGWVEMVYLAAGALVLLVVCVPLVAGRAVLRVEVELEPRRVVVGTPAAGTVTTINVGGHRLLPLALELPVGVGTARFMLPSLGSSAAHEEIFVVPTQRRGVIPVGPATTVRGDPLGLLRRTVAWTGVTELFVHPATVPLEPLGAGLLRDLEGQTTNDISMSDLAFHALREYAPGDDRRHIHWRSSAKLSTSAGDGRFMVRQFVDTRRSHVTVVVDARLESYGSADELEVAISVGASLAVRSLRDEQDTTVVVGTQGVSKGAAQTVLDGFARAVPGPEDLADRTARASQLAPDTSLALLVTGASTTFPELQRAAGYFPPEVRTVALRVDPAAAASVQTVGSVVVVTLPGLSDLAAVLRGASS
jgi:uncharacterized protein (DUF58 family)